jgi:hypothetical protein
MMLGALLVLVTQHNRSGSLSLMQYRMRQPATNAVCCLFWQGFGWAIAKALAEAGCEISLGVWVSGTYRFCPLVSTRQAHSSSTSSRTSSS